jgi:predicted GIY-YIG superfamily endonuclease
MHNVPKAPVRVHSCQQAQWHIVHWRDDKFGSRIEAHRAGAVPGFTRKYAVRTLVYAEPHETIGQALLREKQIKKWRRTWKLELIERDNPQWRDLFEEYLLCFCLWVPAFAGKAEIKWVPK